MKFSKKQPHVTVEVLIEAEIDLVPITAAVLLALIRWLKISSMGHGTDGSA